MSVDCPVHWHEFYEIEYVLEGGGVCYINNQPFNMQKGNLFLMTPVDFHGVKTNNATVINIMFSADMVTPNCLAPYTTQNTPKMIALTPETTLFVESLLYEIVKEQKNIRFCSALLDTLLLKLSEYIKKDCNSAQTLSQKMRFFVITNFREKITLKDMADAVGVTPSYASALFKAQTNMGFKQYLNALRFEYAKKLLIFSELTVQQICNDSGFDDYPNFIRRFKIRFGLSPTEYRKQKT